MFVKYRNTKKTQAICEEQKFSQDLLEDAGNGRHNSQEQLHNELVEFIEQIGREVAILIFNDESISKNSNEWFDRYSRQLSMEL